MKIDNQIVELKSEGHPDELADSLSETAVTAIYEHNEDLYVNLDSCYLKAGRFPEFILGGQMSFDFNIYSKEDRYELEDYVRSRIIDRFKEVFPDAKINVKFQISLYPNPKEELVINGRHDETTFVTAFYPFSEQEKEARAIHNYIEKEIDYCGKDFKVIILPDSIVVQACFFEEDDSLAEKLRHDISYTFDTIKNIDSLVVNPEQEYSGVTFNRFGSTLFNNKSGVSGRGNDLYGFRSPQRPMNIHNIRGKDSRASVRTLFKTAFTSAKSHYENNDEPLNVTAFSVAGEDKEEIDYIANQQTNHG